MSYAKKRTRAGGKVTYTAVFLNPDGWERSAGTFDGRREAQRAARRAQNAVESAEWIDPVDGKLTFERYVEDYWWPSRQLELTTRAAYRSYLDTHTGLTTLPARTRWRWDRPASGPTGRSRAPWMVTGTPRAP